MAARGLGPEELIKGVQQGSIDLLSEWTLSADQVTVF
jgi:sulfur relay (sulfurtransferase) complex TusBCD TusD component (DsrE family)